MDSSFLEATTQLCLTHYDSPQQLNWPPVTGTATLWIHPQAVPMTDWSSGVCPDSSGGNGRQSRRSTLTGQVGGTPAVVPYNSLITSTESHLQRQTPSFYEPKLWMCGNIFSTRTSSNKLLFFFCNETSLYSFISSNTFKQHELADYFTALCERSCDLPSGGRQHCTQLCLLFQKQEQTHNYGNKIPHTVS